MKRDIVPANYNRVVFTEEMRKNYTILCPQMSPIHFELLEPAFQTGAVIPLFLDLSRFQQLSATLFCCPRKNRFSKPEALQPVLHDLVFIIFHYDTYLWESK